MKPWNTWTAVVAYLVMFLCRASADLNDGLAAYYPFSGNANDASGNGHNGSLTNWPVTPPNTNGPTFTQDRFGNPTSALQFDGTNDYVSIPDSSAWNFGTNSFTVALWVNFRAVKRTMLIGQSDGAGQNTSKWFMEYGGVEFSDQSSALPHQQFGFTRIVPRTSTIHPY